MEEIFGIFFGLGGLSLGAVALMVSLGIVLVFYHKTSGFKRKIQLLELRMKALEEGAVEREHAQDEPAVGQVGAPEDASLEPSPSTEELVPLEIVAGRSPVSETAATEEVARPPAPGFVLPSPERVAVMLGAAIGAFALLIGGLLGLVAVMESGWFGPAMRICFSLVAGTLIWLLGAGLRGRLRAVPSALSGVGMGTLFGALFAAHAYYGLLGPMPTMVALVAVSVVAGIRANVLDDRFMAHLGLIGGVLAPVLVSSGENGALGLFAYLFVLLLGVLGVAGRRRWPDIVLAAATYTCLLHLGWTATWYAPDSVWIALLGAVALSVPFALVAGLVRDESRRGVAVRTAAVVSALVWSLVILVWLVPIDNNFVDPRSGLMVVQSSATLPLFGALAILAAPLPLWLVGRFRHSVKTATSSALFGAIAAIIWVLGWAYVYEDVNLTLLLGSLAPLVLGLGVHVGARREGAFLGVGVIPVMIALSGAAAAGTAGPMFAAGSVALSVLCAVAAHTSSSGALIFVGAIAQGALLFVGAVQVESLGLQWVATPAMVALGLFSASGLARRWKDDPIPLLGWLGGLLITPVLFPAFYLCWKEGLGKDVIGLLPVLLGGVSLLGALVLQRGHGVKLHSSTLALAVGLALAGVTFALPLQLASTWLTVGWAVEAAALAVLATRLRHPLVRAVPVLIGLVIGARLLLNPYALSYGGHSGWPIFNWTLNTWGIPTVALLVVAHFTHRTRPEKNDLLGWAPVVLRLMAMGTAFALVNMEVSHAFGGGSFLPRDGVDFLRSMTRSLAWGGFGLGLLVIGLVVRSRYTRFIGFAFLILTAAKVFVFDSWALPGFIRVVSLIGLGLVLIISAFLFERLVLRDEDDKKVDS